MMAKTETLARQSSANSLRAKNRNRLYERMTGSAKSMRRDMRVVEEAAVVERDASAVANSIKRKDAVSKYKFEKDRINRAFGEMIGEIVLRSEVADREFLSENRNDILNHVNGVTEHVLSKAGPGYYRSNDKAALAHSLIGQILRYEDEVNAGDIGADSDFEKEKAGRLERLIQEAAKVVHGRIVDMAAKEQERNKRVKLLEKAKADGRNVSKGRLGLRSRSLFESMVIWNAKHNPIGLTDEGRRDGLMEMAMVNSFLQYAFLETMHLFGLVKDPLKSGDMTAMFRTGGAS